MTAMVDPRKRKALLAAVHAEAKKAGLDEESYRDLVEQVSGQRSARALSLPQLGAVLDRLKGGTGRRSTSLPGEAHHRKARALWLSLWQLGVLQEPSEEALNAFCERQTGIARLAWLRPDQAAALIDALKDWCRREGFAVPPTARDGGRAAKAALVAALDAKLRVLQPETRRMPLPDLSAESARQLDRMAEELGRRVRRASGQAEASL